jgi:hypothetical protein
MSEEQSKPQAEGSQLNDEPPLTNWIIPEGGPPEVFADWYYVNWLPLTVRIRFGQIVANPTLPPGSAKSSWVIDERIALTMPWHSIKQLSIMLTSIVAAYEKENGEVTIPKIPNV